MNGKGAEYDIWQQSSISFGDTNEKAFKALIASSWGNAVNISLRTGILRLAKGV